MVSKALQTDEPEILSTGCPSGTLSENTNLRTLLADNLKRTYKKATSLLYLQ
jgi:hypothetical protein